VLLFLHSPSCSACRAFLEAVNDRFEDYERENTRFLAIYPSPVEDLSSLPSFPDRGIDFLADLGDSTRQVYQDLMIHGLVQPDEVMLFVLDNYGAPYVCLKGEEPEVPAQEDLLGWLRYIGIQCPE
jgi:hypothetical protein